MNSINPRGLYSEVGRSVFAVDTQKLKLNRVKSATYTKKETKKVEVARAQANGPLIIDHSLSGYDGLLYSYPKNFYCPLRSSKTDQSKAQSIYGGHKPQRVQLRNPKSYIKKHGDMSQKIAIRGTEIPEHERYPGSDCYVDMFKTMEIAAFSQKLCVSLPSGKFIEREPKGAPIKANSLFGYLNYFQNGFKSPPNYREDPTTYKKAFLDQTNADVQHPAGLPLKLTPIGEW